MNKRYIFLFCLLFFCAFTCAQKDSIPQLVERLEASGDNNASVNTITKLLKNNSLSVTDKLALQTTLIHKYQELQQWDVCLNYCQQQLAEAHKQNNALEEATFYKMIGNTYYHIPNKDKAIEYWQKCIEVSEGNHFNELLEQCYHNIGSVYIDRGEHYDLAEKYLQQAVILGIANKTDGQSIGRLHSRLLATLYERTNQLDKAAKAYNDVIKECRENNDSINLAEALMFSSDVLRKQQKLSEAVQVSDEALRISRKIAKLDMVLTALNFCAMNQAAAGNYKEAYILKNEASGVVTSRYNNDLNTKLSEAEAKFKSAEAEHEKQLALVKERKQNQLLIIGLISLFTIATLLFSKFYQRRNAKQKIQMQRQLQDEKERLSRDLHDNLGSQMALLSNNIETLDTNFKKQLGIDGNIEKVKNNSKQLLQTLREAIWILNKEQVTAQEFFDKLIDYAQRYLQSYPAIQLRVEENFSSSKNLNPNESLQLFRICQEAITNSSKYSGSKALLIKGNVSNNFFTAVIQDFGKGFDMAAINSTGHYGLINMQQRAKAINATIKVDAVTDKGVSIIITI